MVSGGGVRWYLMYRSRDLSVGHLCLIKFTSRKADLHPEGTQLLELRNIPRAGGSDSVLTIVLVILL